MYTHGECTDVSTLLLYIDIDECEDGTHNCSGDARCNNTAGNYTCECFDGFEGDGFNCTGNGN